MYIIIVIIVQKRKYSATDTDHVRRHCTSTTDLTKKTNFVGTIKSYSLRYTVFACTEPLGDNESFRLLKKRTLFKLSFVNIYQY